jgi:hypothetical protein
MKTTYPLFTSTWNEDYSKLTVSLADWGGPKHLPCLVSRYLFDEGIDKRGDLPFKLLRVGPWDDYCQSAPFVRSDSLRGIIIGHLGWAVSTLWNPIRLRFWRLAFRLNALDCPLMRYPTWRDLRWPGTAKRSVSNL